MAYDLRIEQGTNIFKVSRRGVTKDMYFSVSSDSAEFGDRNNSIDVKIWGATSGAYMLWDSSTDDLKFGGGAGGTTNSATTHGIYMTSGSVAHSFVGFAGTGEFHNLFSWDSDAYNLRPISALGCKDDVNSDGSLICDLNGTAIYIPYYLVANME